MIIEQEEKGFASITIKLTTRVDAENFWEMARYCKSTDEGARTMAIAISNWFSNEAQL